MNCIGTTKLQGYLEANLQPAERIVIEEHLAVCKSCSDELLELKLLLWELDDMKNVKLPIPPETAKVRAAALNKLFESSQEPIDVAKILKLQKKNMEYSSAWVNFIPGVKAGKGYLKKGLNKAPSAAAALSGLCLKGGFKLLQARLSP